MKRLKVLISAYACEPDQGSEPGVGWNVAREMATYHDIWVITRANNRPAIERELSIHPVKGLHFVYFDLPRWARRWKKGKRGVQLYYYLWQLGIYPHARRMHQQVGFDLTHHVTFVKYWAPSLLALLPIPFLWGPVGGGEAAPKLFRREFSRRGRLYESMRDMAQWLGEYDPLVRLTARRSKATLATTKGTLARVKILGAKDADVQSEAALSAHEVELFKRISRQESGPIRFISMGRLLNWKGFHLGIRAFAMSRLNQAEYWIAGDGPERYRLERLAKMLGVADRVLFLGKLPRKEALENLAMSTALVHPSLHDSGGWVCLEGMAAGKPVICLDLGGPATQVTEGTGIKVIAHNPEQAVHDLAIAMKHLAENITLRESMGKAGMLRVKNIYSWPEKGRRFDQFYEKIIS